MHLNTIVTGKSGVLFLGPLPLPLPPRPRHSGGRPCGRLKGCFSLSSSISSSSCSASSCFRFSCGSRSLAAVWREEKSASTRVLNSVSPDCSLNDDMNPAAATQQSACHSATTTAKSTHGYPPSISKMAEGEGLSVAPLRSLDDFLLESARFQIPNLKDPDKWANRVIQNLLYYQTNYFLTYLVIFAVVGCRDGQRRAGWGYGCLAGAAWVPVGIVGRDVGGIGVWPWTVWGSWVV
ncbi:PRA1 family protein 2 [Portunus trituberculatus]|uniref:PRA1 family protein n=1 Tax=Portunus trituberculatus TaxID=210409 RepID=A0A5B7E8S3_PORTR|nr:PRA1 family protein 2 [Portunus trituberculatus]